MKNTAEYIVWYDLETSGFSHKKHAIIQMAAVATERATLEVVGKLECKIQFNEKFADANALEGNSYNKEVWAREAIFPVSAFQLIDKFFKEYISWKRISAKGNHYEVTEIGGHNLQFDNEFLKEFYKRHTGSDWTGTSAWRGGYVDTLDIAKAIQVMSGERWEDGFKLGVLCDRFGVKLDNAHDALVDVEATIELYRKLRDVVAIDNNKLKVKNYTDQPKRYGAFESSEKTTEFINDR